MIYIYLYVNALYFSSHFLKIVRAEIGNVKTLICVSISLILQGTRDSNCIAFGVLNLVDCDINFADLYIVLGRRYIYIYI